MCDFWVRMGSNKMWISLAEGISSDSTADKFAFSLSFIHSAIIPHFSADMIF